MNKTWQLQDAKSHFSEVIERAKQGEVQIITKYGKKTAVIISYDNYLKYKQENKSLLDILRREPYFDFEFERSKDTGRNIDFE